MSEQVAQPKKRRLTGKQKTFIAEYIANGKNGTRAAMKAYNANSEKTAGVISSENLGKPSIREAIDQALIKHDADPGFAVRKIVNVANMKLDNKSAPSVLKASNTILELHGWRKDERPNMTLNINQFFSKSRNKQQPKYVENEAEDIE